MRRTRSRVGLILTLMAAPLAAGAGAGDAGDDAIAGLRQADLDFAAAVAAEGLDGWLAFMADDAVRLPGLGEAGVQGKEAIAGLDGGMFADPDRRLVWEPTAAGIFADGRHGYTTGRYRVLVTAGGEETVAARGSYITWWRRQDGSWKVILDTGAPE